MAHLFDTFTLRDLTLRNRIAVPAMCQYSARDGLSGDWHFAHYGARAVGGAALIVSEAIAVVPDGRISSADLGLWDDGQIEALARVVRFALDQGCPMAAQLAHAGRKASVRRGWEAPAALPRDQGGWPLTAPSPIAFSDAYPKPAELDAAGIAAIVERFADAARRARDAGFSAVEIHAAHGYLLHQFLSPLANRRADDYGGSFANRTRLLIEVVDAVRAVWPDRLPLIARLSATDWVDGGWTPEETVAVCRVLKTRGVDLIDVSSGGIVPDAKIPAGPGFQIGFAEQVRREADIPSAAVGLITAPEQADRVVRGGQADMVLIGREILRNPYWPMTAARELGHAAAWPAQYLCAAPAGAKMR
ncbi:MAG: NADH:flavin oxidoreductase/NADH oxidase [Candidatus Accumulibacter sp.]|jgi:2,4-dienoyl-CoA reductase-like NADH-dependent reductase (Old Yellow Enzyme family)|nr:NADH:flavin oxidoreductase/NADH oxidase [Accumulibacter sp.]